MPVNTQIRSLYATKCPCAEILFNGSRDRTVPVAGSIRTTSVPAHAHTDPKPVPMPWHSSSPGSWNMISATTVAVAGIDQIAPRRCSA